jgi:Putative DNA-binding domain
MSEIQTQSQHLFEKYTNANSVDFIKSLPNLPEKTFENDWLEFKSGKARDEDIKKIWSKAIGAFANSEGGIIVWGVSAKKDQTTGIDAVNGIELVPDVCAFKTRLMELRHEACDPPVANIDIKELPISNTGKEGFVVCHIPESSNKPHRSEFPDKHFFLRMGDSSRECNVSVLRQLFYPKKNPRIEAGVKRIQPPHNFYVSMLQSDILIGRVFFTAEIGIRNIGEISVDKAQAHIECRGFSLFSYQWNKFSKEFEFEKVPTIQPFGSPIHPTIRNSINIVSVSASEQSPIDFEIKVYARDMLPRKVVLRLPEKAGESVFAECLPI